MRIIGIDPGLATIGIGVLDVPAAGDYQVVEWFTIVTPSGVPLSDRLKELYDDISTFLEECKPTRAVVERLFFATNERTALDVAHARGAILLALSIKGIPFIEPTPLQLKAAITGDGKADKRQVQDMLVRMLNLKTIPQPDDAADALALAVYGALQLRSEEWKVESGKRTVS